MHGTQHAWQHTTPSKFSDNRHHQGCAVYRQTSSKAALDGGVSYAGSSAKQELQESTVEASEAGAASTPEEVLSASIEKVSWVPEVTFGPRVTQPGRTYCKLLHRFPAMGGIGGRGWGEDIGGWGDS